jgi:hypothetical protein
VRQDLPQVGVLQCGCAHLCANPNATLYSFDIEFPQQSLASIQRKFGEGFIHIKGDSTRTLTQFAAQREPPTCDLMIVDGGHYDPVPASDLANFARLAAKSQGKPHTVIIDEIFKKTNDMTDALVEGVHSNMFDASGSRCIQRETNRSFPLNSPAFVDMKDGSSPLWWCELVFAKEILAALTSGRH